MKRVLEFIEQKKREQDASRFLAFIRDQSIHPGSRFSFVPCMAPFVMGFADLNKYVLRDEASQDPLQKVINTHTQEDDHHFGMFLRDLKTLGLDTSLNLSGALKLLWSEESRRSRQILYGLTALIASASPVMRMAIVEAIEAAGNVGFKRYNQTAAEFHQLTGLRLYYFGEAHLDLESGHAMGTENVEQKLSEIVLTPEQVEQACALVARVFELIIDMGEGFMEYMRIHGLINPRVWASSGAAIGS
ncbi:MAG: hypothetical protein ACJ8AT_00525 [Hyalangium sp.]|uniref:hypothetical protein n=1 Tax=Hyalangium sp. TaxID=2028555 RepID=UPI003899E9D1